MSIVDTCIKIISVSLLSLIHVTCYVDTIVSLEFMFSGNKG